jgi:hypothetical protein
MLFWIVPPNISDSRRGETKQYTNMYLSSKPAMIEDNGMMPNDSRQNRDLDVDTITSARIDRQKAMQCMKAIGLRPVRHTARTSSETPDGWRGNDDAALVTLTWQLAVLPGNITEGSRMSSGKVLRLLS